MMIRCVFQPQMAWCLVLLGGSLFPAVAIEGAEEAATKIEQRIVSVYQSRGSRLGESPMSTLALEVVDYLDAQSDDQLRELAKGDRPSVALLSSWQIVQRAAKDDKQTQFDAFLKTLEQHLGIPPSDDWLQLLTSAARLRPANVGSNEFSPSCCTMKKGEGGHKVQTDRLTIHLHASQKVSVAGEKMIFECDKHRCEVEHKAFHPIGKGTVHQLSYYLDSDVLLVAMIDHSGVSYPLFCFNTIDGQPLWMSDVWATLSGESLLFRPKGGVHCLQLQRTGNRMVLLGYAGWAVYCEAYELESGDCSLRFASNVWNGISVRERRNLEQEIADLS